MEKLTFSQKLARLGTRLADPEWRRFGTLLLTGKLTGIGLLVLVFVFTNPDLFGMRALAADPVLRGNDIVNPLNTVWTLVAAYRLCCRQHDFGRMFGRAGRHGGCLRYEQELGHQFHG